MPNRSKPCSCRRTCGDVPERDDDPLAVCRGLPGARYGYAVTEDELAEERALLDDDDRAELDALPTSRGRREGGRLNDDATYNRSSVTDGQLIELGMYDLVSSDHPIRQRGDSMG